jgi:hypothetical protein
MLMTNFEPLTNGWYWHYFSIDKNSIRLFRIIDWNSAEERYDISPNIESVTAKGHLGKPAAVVEREASFNKYLGEEIVETISSLPNIKRRTFIRAFFRSNTIYRGF